MDEALRQYQQDLAKAQISRRRFMAGAAMASVATFLAACAPPTGSASTAPSAATAVPTGSASGGASPSEVAAASVAPTPQPSYQLEQSMLLYNWSDYFSPDNQAAFQKDLGVTINQTTFASNEEMLAKLKAGGKGQYDVAVPTAEFSATLAADGYLQKLDKSRLPNLKLVNQRFLTLPFDPNDDYIVPKDWGTTGIIYRGNKMTDPITSWKDFFDLAKGKYSGKTFVLDSPGDVFVAPLRLHGYDVNTTDKDQLETARQELMALRPHLQSIDSDNYPTTLEKEAAVLGLAWNGSAYVLQSDPSGKYKDTGWVIPTEGTIYWTDTWVLLADAPNPNAAYAFLNWIQDPKQQVVESLYAGYASCNDQAKSQLPADFVNNPAVYVPDAQLSLLQVATDQSGNQQRADIWAEFKQG
ncbi:MAG TPA: extracellular solute-binding protein [Candidatus Limnocylindrales bacterium]|nr:extracellular solute-binding protein [Candidatus Limnocylindrales bacterium]